MATALLRLLAAVIAAACLVGCASLPDVRGRPESYAIDASDQTSLGRLALRSTPDPTLTGVRLLPTGPFALSTRTALIERAQRTLDLQYYLLQDDVTGRYVLHLLKAAGARGVRVRLLLDDMYTSGMDELLAGAAAHENVEVRLFNPFTAGRGSVLTRFAASASDFHRVNHRMHNKLFVADGAMAIVGGRNIADSYFMRDPNQNFADVDALMVGAVVGELAKAFDDYWNSELSIPIENFARGPAPQAHQQKFKVTDDETLATLAVRGTIDVLGYGPIAEELDDARLGLIWGVAHAWVDLTEKVWNCRPIPEGSTAPHLHTVRLRVEEMMRGARRDVTFSSPYFIPGSNGMDLFEDGVRNGVSFKVLTNSLAATDEPLAHWGYRRYRHRMLEMGMQLYELSPTRASRDRSFGLMGSKSLGRLHAKTAVVDGSTVFIGSMNFDPRSDALNTEIGVVFEGPQLAREVLRLMNLDKLQSSYLVRLSPVDKALEWVGIDEYKEVVRRDEPDVDFSMRLYLQLLAPLVAESML